MLRVNLATEQSFWKITTECLMYLEDTLCRVREGKSLSLKTVNLRNQIHATCGKLLVLFNCMCKDILCVQRYFEKRTWDSKVSVMSPATLLSLWMFWSPTISSYPKKIFQNAVISFISDLCLP